MNLELSALIYVAWLRIGYISDIRSRMNMNQVRNDEIYTSNSNVNMTFDRSAKLLQHQYH